MDDYVTYINMHKSTMLPHEYRGFMWTLDDITYNDMQVKFNDFYVDFDEEKQEVIIDFPLIKHFQFKGHFVWDRFLGFFKLDSPTTVKINNMEMKARISEDVKKDGYPLFYTPELSFSI
jgi:hypothetical protein